MEQRTRPRKSCHYPNGKINGRRQRGDLPFGISHRDRPSKQHLAGGGGGGYILQLRCRWVDADTTRDYGYFGERWGHVCEACPGFFGRSKKEKKNRGDEHTLGNPWRATTVH